MPKYVKINDGDSLCKLHKHISCYGLNFDRVDIRDFGRGDKGVMYVHKYNEITVSLEISYNESLKSSMYCASTLEISNNGKLMLKTSWEHVEIFKSLEFLTASLLNVDELVEDGFACRYGIEQVNSFVMDMVQVEFIKIFAEMVKNIPPELRNYDNPIQKLLDFAAIKDILE